MSEPARVVTTIDQHVAHVRMNRADKRNGLDLEMFQALVAAGDAVADDRGVRAVVLSGEGKAFCAGLDWKAFMQRPDAAPIMFARDAATSPANLAQRAAWVWAECPVPVIAAIHGVAFGGGLQIALACDLRVVAPDAQLSVMEIKYALTTDMTASKTLARLVRPDVAKDLLFTGRVVGGAEAVQIGLATRVADDPVAAALATARDIAGKSPHAVRAGKRLFDAAHDLSVADAFALEAELQRGLLGSPNQLEAVRAVMTQQTANFRDV